jgi:enoyl-CoA hydratase/carnithine racemase
MARRLAEAVPDRQGPARAQPGARQGNSGAGAGAIANHAEPPDRKNPLTFDSYGELRDLFREMVYATDIKAMVFTGEGGNFCSGGDVHEIIGPLVKMDMPELLQFTRMTGDLVKAMRACPQPIIAAIDGVCTGAGAMIACGSDMRLATARSKLAFLFVRVGLAGADMGACTLLPRLIGLSRAADLLYTGRVVGGEEAERFGFYNRLVEPEQLLAEAQALAQSLADGPTFGHAMTKTMLWQEWNAGLGECIEAEAQAQAICMQTNDFERAYHAFAAKQSRSSKATEPWPHPPTWTGRSSTTATARWRRASSAGRMNCHAAPRREDSLDAVYACVRAGAQAGCRAGLLRVCVPAAYGGLRETWTCASAWAARRWRAHSGLADFALAMQGLGSAPVTLFGSHAQKQQLLPGVAAGHHVAAFALSEPDAGSDVAP